MKTIIRDGFQGVLGHGLSRRELEFTISVAAGMTDKQIAREAGLSPDSVRKRLTSAMFKLGAHRRAQLVAEAMRRAIISPLVALLTVCCIVVNSTPDNQLERAPRLPRNHLTRTKGGGRKDDLFFNPFDYV